MSSANTEAIRTIDDLLAIARSVAIEAFEGRPATPENLGYFAETVRAAIRTQVRLGLWRSIGISEVSDIIPLKVTAHLGRPLLDEPPIVLVYDFSRTVLPALVVKNKVVV